MVLLTRQDEPEHILSAINNVINHFGPAVTETLIINIGGRASRSEVDTLAELLRKLISRQVEARNWLEQALFKDTFPSNEVNAETKRFFLQKILGLVLSLLFYGYPLSLFDYDFGIVHEFQFDE